MSKVVLWNGVLLWQSLRWWDPQDNRTGAMARQGVFQTRVKNVPDSPNFDGVITVRTCIDKVTPLPGISAQGTFRIGMDQVAARLRGGGSSLGDLAWVDDVSRLASVVGGPYPSPGPSVVTVSPPGGGWSPTAGHYVVLRNPTTQEGLVAVIEAVGASTITVTHDGHTITSDWEVSDVLMHWPDAGYLRHIAGEPQNSGADTFRSNVSWVFACSSDLVYPPGYEVPM